MAVKYSATQNMKFIYDESLKNGMDPCFMIAKAKIESTLNNTAKNGKYAGLFQLSDGIGGCKGDARFDPTASTRCTVKYINYNRGIIEPKLQAKGMQWENWMAYLAHQQGAGGFTAIVLNPNTLIADSSKKKAILNNLPKAARATCKTHADFVNWWKSRFQNLAAQCSTELSCFGITGNSGVSDLATSNLCPTAPMVETGLPSKLQEKKEENNMLLVTAAAIAAGYVGYKYFGK